MSIFKSNAFNSIFPPPSYLTLCPYSIDLSPNFVSLMYLKRDKVGLVPDEYKKIMLKETCDLLESHEDLSKCNELKSVLTSLKEEFGLKFVNVSLPETKTYIFRTEIHKEAVDTIEESISFKIEENVPLSLEDVVFDYSVIHASEDHLDVVVTVFPKSVIDAYTTLLNEIGLIPVSFESESQSLARSLVNKDNPSSYLILNMTEMKIGVAIVENNVVQYTSSIPIESTSVIKDLNGPDADNLKKQVNKLLIYWFTNKTDLGHRNKINTVILSGKYSTSPGLLDFLAKHLSVKVEIGNVWKNCFDLNKYIPPLNQKDSLEYAVAVGLSLIHH